MQDLAKNSNKRRVDTEHFPCPSCGGNMTFDPESQSLSCHYCGKNMEITNEDDEIFEYDLETIESDASDDWGNEKRVIHCENCGAETVLDEYTTAKFCAFCGSSQIAKIDNSAGIVPESLIPFSISNDKAMEMFSKWIKSHFFAPNSLKKDYQIDRMTGVYIPCWTYDAETNSSYRGQAGYYYYVTETYTVQENGETKIKTRQVRKIRWVPVSGIFTEYFDDVLINASKNVDEELMSKISPFDFKDLVRYQPEYLSGFQAERYSVQLLTGWNQAKEFIKEEIRSGIIEHIHADQVRDLRIKTNYHGIKYKHILLPIWICSYTYKKKVYRYLVNGQTGEVQGETPLSPWKIAITILSVIAVITLIFLWLQK